MIEQYDLDGHLLNTFNSAEEAAKLTGTDRRRIYMVCSGKRNKTNGFIWKYKE